MEAMMVETSRRQLFRTGGLAAAAMAMPYPFPALAREGSASAYDLPERDDISHLVSRLTFGLTETELSLARTLGYEGYLDYHLDPDAIDDGSVEEILSDRLPSLSWSLAEMADLARDDPEVRAQIRREFQVATLYRAIYSPRQLFEVMVEFWGNHFAVNALGLADGTFDRDLRLSLPDVQSWATTPAATIDTLVERILARQIAETDRQTLINHAAGGGPVDGEIPIDQRETVARGVLGLLLVSRYFQTR
jgi:hypothetical protein